MKPSPAGIMALVIVLLSVFPSPAGAASGDRLWVSVYKGPAGGWDGASALSVSPDGARVYVTGSSEGRNGLGDYVTVGYAAGSGRAVWISRYDGRAHGHDEARALAVSPDGSTVYVTGSVCVVHKDYCRNQDYGTGAYDAGTGARQWVVRYEGPGRDTDYAASLAVSPDGRTVYVTGSSDGKKGECTFVTIGCPDFATVAYDAATGRQVWTARYDGPAQGLDLAPSVAVSPDGRRVYVTGSSEGDSFTYDYATIGYDAATGEQLWVSRYGLGSDIEMPCCLTVSPDGARVFVTGDVRYDMPGYATVAYDAATGAQLWAAHYAYAHGSSEPASDIGLSPDGSRVFVSYTRGTIAYDSTTGTELWVARYRDSRKGRDRATSLALSPDGARVYVAGHSGPAGALDLLLIAYDAATGSRLWVARYGRKDASEEASDVAVSPDGASVFVTGSGDGDYVTVAYGA